jgi:hypothetical protein
MRMIRKVVCREIFWGIALWWLWSGTAAAVEMPACLAAGKGETPASVIAAHRIGDRELLARLVYAEGISTGFGEDLLVYQAIAWGVMNRVRLGEVSTSMRRTYGRGIRGVIFKKGQFNPAVSPRSAFSRTFLCPDHAPAWVMAKAAAEKALAGKENPFLQTEWEKKNGLSLVVNFYYPRSIQARGPLPPWEKSRALTFTGAVQIEGQTLPVDRIRFYRLIRPPGGVHGK